MSRIGKKPITLPSGVEVTVEVDRVSVKGPKGSLSEKIPRYISVAVEGQEVRFERAGDSKTARANHGLIRALTANMVTGVSKGFSRDLEIHGVGYKANLRGSNLNLSLGFSHPVLFPVPSDIQIKLSGPTKISVSGIDKGRVGQVSATLRGFRPPDSYKGKGVRYADEQLRLKAGKTG
jgi:large subunit ribosomal protein L6